MSARVEEAPVERTSFVVGARDFPAPRIPAILPRMSWRLVLLTLALAAVPARADAQSACEAKCTQQSVECLKVCTGDPKDAQKPAAGERLMACVRACEAQTLSCKAACGRR